MMESIDISSEKPKPTMDKVGIDIEDQEVEEKAGSTHRNRKVKPFVYLLAMTAALGALVFGFSLTGAGGSFVMKGFQEHFGWACPDGPDASCTPKSDHRINAEKSMITALQSTGSLVGAVFNPFVFDTIGRKWTVFNAALLFTVGAIAQCSAFGIADMLVGRVISGFGIGMMAMSVPVYIAECAPSHKRGQLVTFWQVGVTVGMLTGTAINVAVSDQSWGWRLSYGGNIFFAVFLMLAMYFYMPESPRYLALQEEESNDGSNKSQLLDPVLRQIRYDDEVEYSREAIQKEIQEEKEHGSATWLELFRQDDKIRYRVLLGMGMQFLNQLSGNESINFYAPTILDAVFGDRNSLVNSFILGIINFAAVFVAVFAVDRVGRVPLWVSGGLVMMCSMIVVSILESMEATMPVNYAFFAMLALFTFAYHGTMGPLAWDICSEMYPLRERGKAAGLSTMSNFLGVILVGAVFPFANAASSSGTFAFFTMMLFLNICLVYFFLPETAERNAMQIEQAFRDHKPQGCRNVWQMADHHSS